MDSKKARKELHKKFSGHKDLVDEYLLALEEGDGPGVASFSTVDDLVADFAEYVDFAEFNDHQDHLRKYYKY